jgi:Transposase DDE domain.
MMNNLLTDENKKLILNIVKELCPHKRTPKFSDSYILDNILLIHNVVNIWRSLKHILHNEKIGHYTTIMKRFHLWTDAGVFDIAHKRLLNKNILSSINSNSTLTCYIDTTHINNMQGKENINISENKKKKSTKLTTICNDNKKILEIKYDHLHDSNMVEPIVKSLKCKTNYRKINIVGDKAYKLNKHKLNSLKNDKVKMHVAQRKNQKIRTLSVTKKHLKQRYKIENVFQQLKTFSRIRIRMDTKTKNYMSLYIWLL